MYDSLRRFLIASFLLVPAAGAAEWEWHGYFGPSGAPEVSLREVSTGRSRWVAPGEFDGDVYVENVDLTKRLVVVYVGGERLVIGFASETPSARETDGADSGIGDDPASREIPEKSKVFTLSISEGYLRLQKEHPEYFGEDRSESDRRALREARRRIISEAAQAARATD